MGGAGSRGVEIREPRSNVSVRAKQQLHKRDSRDQQPRSCTCGASGFSIGEGRKPGQTTEDNSSLPTETGLGFMTARANPGPTPHCPFMSRFLFSTATNFTLKSMWDFYFIHIVIQFQLLSDNCLCC